MSIQVNRQAGLSDLTKNDSGLRPGQYSRWGLSEQGMSYSSPSPYAGVSGLAGPSERTRTPYQSYSPRSKPMERVTARVPELQDGSKGAPKKESRRLARIFRGEKGKPNADKISISAPLAVVKNSPLVSGYCPPPPSTRPPRPARPEDLQPYASGRAGMVHPSTAMASPPSVPTDVIIDPSKLAAGRSEWRKAHPVPRISLSGPRLQESEEERHLCSRRSRRSCNLDRLSMMAVINDPDAASVGVAVSPSYADTVFPQDDGEVSAKQARRRGMVFGPADFDMAMFAGQQFGGNIDIPDNGSDEEPETTEESPSTGDVEGDDCENDESNDGEDDSELPSSDPSPDCHGSNVPEIRITSPLCDISVVSNQYLSPDHAWKRIAEKYHREAKREHDDAEEILEMCAPLMAAFDLIRTVPEFAHLDSWDGAFEVMQQILEERELTARERDAATARADWFQKQWFELHQEITQLRPEDSASAQEA